MSKKSKDLITTLLVAFTGSYLFYKTDIGLNILIFTVLSVMVAIQRNRNQQIRKILTSVTPVLICSMFISIYPQTLSFIIWIICYLVMWSSISHDLQPIVILLQSITSVIQKPLISLRKTKKGESSDSQNKKRKTQLVILTITSAIVLSFFLLYANSNPIFSNLLARIDLSFIEFGFILMVIAMSILLFGLISIKRNQSLAKLNQKSKAIQEGEISDKNKKEYNIGKLSMLLVAILLAIVNLIDIIVIFTGELPVGVTYAEYVHQGFYSLILTLSLAIGLIIYFYRGQLNFHDKVSTLKRVSYLWISQNLILALITAYKNFLYIEAYGLTYKRIAVILCLICVLIGLFLSIKKVKSPISNWLYFNKLSFYAFVCSIFISLLPFDLIITSYNLKYSQTTDIDYILNLDKPDLYMLYNYIHSEEFPSKRHIRQIDERVSEIEENSNIVKWQSWSFYLNHYKE